MDEPTAYPYQPLQWRGLHDGQIRIIILEPSTDPEAPIVCRLVARFLEDGPDYEALSYTWGPSADTVAIKVEGHAVSIQLYLYNALKALRLKDTPRRIWADAICINQSDALEKSRVVREMHTIYYRAKETIIWVGRAGEDTPLAFYIFKMLAEHPNSKNSSLELKALGSLLRDKPWIHTVAHWTALANFFGRAYWTRAWIVQEIAYSKKGIVKCGPLECPFEWVSTACKKISRESGVRWAATSRISSLVYYKLIGMRTPVVTSLYRWFIRPEGQGRRDRSMRSLAYVLSSLRIFRSTDPRDKVYGCLMLASPASQPLGLHQEHIDYAEPCAKLYARVARGLIEQDSSLRLLSSCEPLNFHSRLGAAPQGDVDENSHMPDLPSWAPNWALRSRPIVHAGDYSEIDGDDQAFPWISRQKSYTAAGATKANVRFSEDGSSMTAKGMILDSIFEIGETCNHKSLREFLAHAADLCSRNPRFAARYDKISNQRDLLLTAVAGNRYRHQHKLSPEDRVILHKSMHKQAKEVLLITTNRPLFTTTSGYVGYGPQYMSVHDTVCLLRGCFVPVVLRRFSVTDAVEQVDRSGGEPCEEDSFYHVIGPAYVHGVMEGEEAALLEKDNLVDFALR